MVDLQQRFKELPSCWQTVLKEEISKQYFKDIETYLNFEKSLGHEIYPKEENIFFALSKTPFESVKVVIIGQDPYHGPFQAHGLSFSVQKGVKIPPSLMNVYKEIKSDLGLNIAQHGDLSYWAEQGVLMLNATLTVRKKEPKSHFGKGWEIFTDAIVQSLVKSKKNIVFLLWGASAKMKYDKLITDKKNSFIHVLSAPHPSPYSAHSGFFGSRHFSITNQILSKSGLEPINWQIPD